jgi:hypothetical protein
MGQPSSGWGMNTQDLEQISIPSEQALSRRVVEHVRQHGKLPSLAQLRTMTADRPSCDSSAVDGPGRVTNRTSALARHLAHRRPGH